jgi:hypothetical protein
MHLAEASVGLDVHVKVHVLAMFETKCMETCMDHALSMLN